MQVHRRWLFALAWLSLLSVYVLAGVRSVPFHGDESTTIWMSKDYAYLFVQNDLDRTRFTEPPIDPAEQQLRLITGSLTKYLMGISWQINGYSVDEINEQWHWGFDWNWNITNGHMPKDQLLHAGRWVSALMLAAGVWAIFALGLNVSGSTTAYFASLFYALHPALLLNGRRAMFEGALILFILVTVLFGLYVLKYRSWWAILGLAIMSGLALSAKHTAAFTVTTVFGVIGLTTLYTYRQNLHETVLPLTKLIGAGLLAFTLFYALHPIWWGDRIWTRAEQVIDGRSGMLDGQVAAFGGYTDVSDQFAGFLRQVFLADPQYYEVPGWDVYIGDQITRYESAIWPGIRFDATVLGLVLSVLAGVGAWSLLHSRDCDHYRGILVLGWAVVMLATTALITPIEWQRYYLLGILPVVLLVGNGISYIGQRISAGPATRLISGVVRYVC